MLYNSGIIVLVISNQPHATSSADLKSLTQLLSACTPLSPITFTNDGQVDRSGCDVV